VPWSAVGHVEEGPVRNPYIGYLYEDGPSDSVRIVEWDGKTSDVAKGRTNGYAYQETMNPCARIDSRVVFKGVVFPQPGTYKIRLVSGYYDFVNLKPVVQDSKPVTVEVSPPSGAAARLSALLPPAAVAGGAALLLLAARAP
jgi:hypothetical protein